LVTAQNAAYQWHLGTIVNAALGAQVASERAHVVFWKQIGSGRSDDEESMTHDKLTERCRFFARAIRSTARSGRL